MGDNILVELTLEEMRMAARVGVEWQLQNLFRGNRPAYGCSYEEGWQPAIVGAIGERVAAKYLKVPWDGNVGNYRAADLGNKRQVRSTPYSSGHLTLHPGNRKNGEVKDPDDHRFILVTGVGPKFKVRGWMFGREAKQKEKYWSDLKGDGRFAFNVPQSDLRSMYSWDSPEPERKE